MLFFTFLSIVCLILFRFNTVTSSHWIVAENGKIQSQLDSVYQMRSPHDLIAFLNQEKRVEKLEKYYNEMLQKESKINIKKTNLDGGSEVESKLYATDVDCLNTLEPLSEEDLYLPFFDDGRELEDFKLLKDSLSDTSQDIVTDPYCTDYSSLEFSMAAFPHLQILSKPWNLEDNVIIEKLHSDVFQYPNLGQILSHQLGQNKSSWFHYNLAAIYWRKKGKPNKAIECAKRAVHFSPRQYKDIPLLNLGSLLRYNEYLIEAAIVLHSALDHAPQKPLIYFTLANVYAFLGDFNKSIACYDNVLHLHSDWRTAQRLRHFINCNWKLQVNLKLLRDGLHDILVHFHEYQELQMKWLKLQEELLSQVAPFEFRAIRPHQDSMSSFLVHTNLLSTNCGYNKKDGHLILKCDYLPHKLTSMQDKLLETKLGLQILANNVLAQILNINEKLLQFSITPPGKQTSHQFSSVEELNLPVRNLKAQKESKFDFENSASVCDENSDCEDELEGISFMSLDESENENESENDDGKLELLEESEFVHNEAKVSFTAARNEVPEKNGSEDTVANSDSVEIEQPTSTKNDKPSKTKSDDPEKVTKSAEMEVEKEASKRGKRSYSSSDENSSSELSKSLKYNNSFHGKENSDSPENIGSHEKIDDLIHSLKNNLKKSLDIDKYSVKLEESIMYYNYLSNLIVSDKEFTENSQSVSTSPLNWSEGNKILGRELEIILTNLKSPHSLISNKAVAFSKEADSGCLSNSCQNAEELESFPWDWNLKNLFKETGIDRFTNIEVFLDVVTWVDISPSLLSPIKTSFLNTDIPALSVGISKCKPSQNFVPDLTASSLTEGKTMMPEPKLMKVLEVIFNDENVSSSKVQQYVEKVLKESSDVWSSATIAALFWRYSGNAENTVACLQQAVSMSPREAKHSPLQIFSYISLTIGHHKEALFLASLAIQISPHSLLSHLTLYKIFSSVGDFNKAQIFKSSSLALLASYNPKMSSR